MKSPLEDLKILVGIPSLSGQETAAADWMQQRLESVGIPTQRSGNNVWTRNKRFDPAKPTLLLNSHLDTVGVCAGWETPPFGCTPSDNRLIGLGINDAGASLIGLLHVFCGLYEESLALNLVFLASAEEENSGPNGLESVRDRLGAIDMAIVGEPTSGRIALAEKGLLVIDATAHGTAGHAARNTGTNAIYKALEDIERLRSHRFAKESALLGPVWMNVTAINGGERHNVVPDRCAFTIDVRLNECYTHAEVLHELQQVCTSELVPRSVRLKPSCLPLGHVLEKAARALNLDCFGSPTMSDQALMPWPSVKFGIGESERSHTANEYIFTEELERGIRMYEAFIKQVQDEIMG